MRKLKATLVLALGLALAGCGPSSSTAPESDRPPNPGVRVVFEEDLPDGRAVTCIWVRQDTRGGLSCDWDNAR